MKNARILIVYYSFTQQTRVLLKRFIAGLESEGVEVAQERLEPFQPFEFPFRTNFRLASAMVSTFFRQRIRVRPINEICYEQYDCIVLAGPTWSYHPSGPILDFLDRFGSSVCRGQEVVPFISCRSYWRLHYWEIRHQLQRCGAIVSKPIVFVHPIREPWRFIGLVLQLRGKLGRKGDSWFRKYYPAYGHTKDQGQEAEAKGVEIGKSMQNR